MKKDDIRTFITIIIICTLIVGIVLILNRKSNSEKLEVVNEYNTFFTTSNYVNNYLNYSSDSSKLYDLLYSDYIDKNNIIVSLPQGRYTAIWYFEEIKSNYINFTIKIAKPKELFLFFTRFTIFITS